ncbi:hypothetical protein [Streptomyces sp. NEAU-S77]|uniref:hypothetical protein n=1 Tax=Streptomyces sp. NEAU-S77 TaxID=3411033 RepID=UPI003BA2A346
MGSFVYEMRTTEDVVWVGEDEEESLDLDTLEDAGAEDLCDLFRRCLLATREGDGQHWLLDPTDVAEDGEWAAYVWTTWAARNQRFPSFAALVAHERDLHRRVTVGEGGADAD